MAIGGLSSHGGTGGRRRQRQGGRQVFVMHSMGHRKDKRHEEEPPVAACQLCPTISHLACSVAAMSKQKKWPAATQDPIGRVAGAAAARQGRCQGVDGLATGP